AARIDSPYHRRRGRVGRRAGEPRSARGCRATGNDAGDLPERPRWLPRRRVRPGRRPGRLRREVAPGPQRSDELTHMLLENKSAIIYGGGGSIGGAVAK